MLLLLLLLLYVQNSDSTVHLQYIYICNQVCFSEHDEHNTWRVNFNFPSALSRDN